MKRVILILCLTTLAIANPTQQKNIKIDDPETIDTKMIKKIDEFSKIHSIRVFGDIVTLEELDSDKIIDNKNTNNNRNYEDPFIKKIEDFFNSRKIKIRLPSDGTAADLFGRALGEKNYDIELRALTEGASEARTKIKKVILPILLALKLKAMIILPIVITVIGIIGIKGLGAGLAALLLSSAVALKALLTPSPAPQYPARISYGVVKPEIHHDHWHRSQEEANQPFKAWAPEYNADPYPYPVPDLP